MIIIYMAATFHGQQPKVLIAGAGLSGLALAQALHTNGFDVHLYERDVSPHARRQGYRITVDQNGAMALKQCLPPKLFEAVRQTASSVGEIGYMRFTNHDLGEIFKLTFKRDPRHNDQELLGQVDRATLRTIMLSGLRNRVATLHFEDENSERGDLIIGADGIHSAIRTKLLPDCPVIDSGTWGIYGKTPLVKNDTPLVPEVLKDSGVIAQGSTPGTFFFYTSMEFNNPPNEVFERLVPDQEAPITENYLMWAIGFPKDALPHHAWDLKTEELHSYALKLVRDFHPVLRKFVEEADIAYTILTPLSVGTRPQYWPASRITLMGDAVHVMPPTGAHGGNTALRDAALLANILQKALENNIPFKDAFEKYQNEMVSYAFKEVNASMRMLKQVNVQNTFIRFMMLRAMPWLRSLVKGPLIAE